jgi:hypothetical protein
LTTDIRDIVPTSAEIKAEKLPDKTIEAHGSSAEILLEANKIIHSDRNKAYGSAEDSFAQIAKYWEDYLGRAISPYDVAMMMVLLKVARAQHGFKRDNLVDICGYAALAERAHGVS